MFEQRKGEWIQLGQNLYGEYPGDEFGVSISLNSVGNIIAISSILNFGNGAKAGHVRVFELKDNLWIQLGDDLDGIKSGDNFGLSVSLNDAGNILAIGAPGYGSSLNTGEVHIVKYSGSSWKPFGGVIYGESAGEVFGNSVCLNSEGNLVVIGAALGKGKVSKSGYAMVYQFENTKWNQKAQKIEGNASKDSFGHIVKMNSNGSIIAISAPNHNNEHGQDAGTIRVFELINDNWTQLGEDIIGDKSGDLSGFNMDLNNSGNIIIIGSPLNQEKGSGSGQVRIFNYSVNNWLQLGQTIYGDELSAYLGNGVAINSRGNMIAIGSKLKNTKNGVNSGELNIYKNDVILDASVSLKMLNEIKLFPNPFHDFVEITTNSKLNIETSSLFDVNGIQVDLPSIEGAINQSHLINLSYLKEGMYFIRIESDSKSVIKKIIKSSIYQ